MELLGSINEKPALHLVQCGCPVDSEPWEKEETSWSAEQVLHWRVGEMESSWSSGVAVLGRRHPQIISSWPKHQPPGCL